MSRTTKGSKGPGYEYWSKRPMAGMNPGAETKRMTHKLERIEAKDAIKEQLAAYDQETDWHQEIDDALYCHNYGPCSDCHAKYAEHRKHSGHSCDFCLSYEAQCTPNIQDEEA